MKNTTKSTTTSASNNGKKTASGKNTSIPHEKLQKLFVDGLKDIYWAEKALTKALPKMIKNATATELSEALSNHLAETEGQVARLEEVFASIEEKAVAKKCEAMAGLIKEGDEIIKDTDKGGMRDAGIITAGQKVEHYEIATYGTLRAFAEILGHETAVDLLGQSLEEEKAADVKLTEVTSAVVMVAEQEELVEEVS